ncbi:MAG: hypothetical protein A2538_04550 [Candidatus Magasanikbacteria bacterium RIFOXYD2_FULL_41_14]|uniref:Glycosyltransferase subfamily 4-like N-terminal domain-containing protein n=1 Tax=Candidatus Magasanikbacteria bacterium RIFOXYD2_FULL_41_14 TaxID=1798709 RepID=A0A1F6PFI7_9BACT|nr:MAG: hypothetical protein A2538_04550 [Candidatus Magasanikbacteria bacterium RIFOXYD2_FULL_41_14]
MRILQINKFFYRRGGAETIFFDTINGQRARGHEVAEFSTRDCRNLPSDYAHYFVENIGEFPLGRGFLPSLSNFFKFFKNDETEKNLSALILAIEPDVAHLHNTYHNLPAVFFKVLKKHKVPIVMTVHDVWPLCPKRRLRRVLNSKLCVACRHAHLFNCACYRHRGESAGANVAGMIEPYYYRFKGIWKLVDHFICPSQFIFDQLLKFGFPKDKLFLLHNPVNLPTEPFSLGNKIVYLGRFHVDKGIKILLQSLPWLRQYETIIAGHGPENHWVENFISQYSLTNVKKIGWVDQNHWNDLMGQAKVVVLPSLVYEGSTLAILEALASGRLVVAAECGGIPEIIKNNQTGFLVKPGDPEALANAVKSAMGMDEINATKIIKNGRELVEKEYDSEAYFGHLEEVYANILANLSKK